ncbi:MAG TPA: hypothetical protein VFC68_05245 [Treponemataceae bacterium]|nr:hypothetical protein [Treponemataceae bacterium]
MAINDTALFSYLPGSSFFHRLPAELKVVLLLICPPLLFKTSALVCVCIMVCFFLFSLVSGIRLKMHIKDIKPILIYCFFIILIKAVFAFYTHFSLIIKTRTLNQLVLFFIPPKQTQLLVLHLICTIQCTSLFFKTTTSLEIKEALENIEQKISFGKSSGNFSQTFALFIQFIPSVFFVWQQINRSWQVRAGKNNIFKFVILLPVFVSVLLKKAHQIHLAITNRKFVNYT